MFRRKFLVASAPFALVFGAQAAAAATLNVVKTAACGCCAAWVEHMKKAGFKVTVRNVADVTPTARRLGVPDALRSCHTSELKGYAVEGHVPAADVRRLLASKPKVAGIAVPGMPMGSPGMEGGGRTEPYKTITFSRSGATRVFAAR